MPKTAYGPSPMPSSPASEPAPQALAARRFSIRARLITLVLAVLLPALWAGLWVLDLTGRMARDSSEQLLEDTTRALSMVLDRELTQRAVVARTLSSLRLLDAAPPLSPAALRDFDEQARRSLNGLGGWLELRSADRLLVNTREAYGVASRRVQMPALIRAPTILPIQTDPLIGVAYAALVQPVLRDGEPVLNLVLTMLPSEFQRIVDEQRLSAGWVATIIDSEGRVVARHPGGKAHAGRRATPDLQAQLLTDREGLMHSVSLDGNPMTLYFHTSPQGWTYITGMPRAQFEGAIPRAMLHVGGAMLLLLALSLLGAAWVARSIVGPIQTIKRMALDLREGRPLGHTRTGLLECDQVSLAMHDASHAVRHAQAELEHQVACAVDRTRSLEQRAAHNQRVEALGRLTGGIAHEFNNLLGVVSNCAHLLRRKAAAPELQPAIGAMLGAVDTGSRLTQHLLRFSGRQAMHPRVLRLAEFLPGTGELLRTLLDRRIELSTTVDATTPPVRVDPNELELSLINLVLNASEAISEQGHVWLSAAPSSERDREGLQAGAYVSITLRDDGHGMEESVARRAFEPFFSTREPNEVGGLGLSQVYGFCLQAGGRARLESVRGQGTSVTLVLPAHTQADDNDAPGTEPPRSASISGARVLLVEDNAALREATAALLASFGCAVVECGGAREALGLIGTAPPFDVVLSDVLMPGDMDGIAMANHLRQILPQLPVVLITGHPGENQPPRGLHMVRKPCAPETLVHAIEQAMARQQP